MFYVRTYIYNIYKYLTWCTDDWAEKDDEEADASTPEDSGGGGGGANGEQVDQNEEVMEDEEEEEEEQPKRPRHVSTSGVPKGHLNIVFIGHVGKGAKFCH